MDFILLIIYNFDFTMANEDFFYQLRDYILFCILYIIFGFTRGISHTNHKTIIASIANLHVECYLILVLAKFGCRVCYTMCFLSLYLLRYSSYLYKLVSNLLGLLDFYCVLVSQSISSSDVPITALQP
jgi:hypothetical protein